MLDFCFEIIFGLVSGQILFQQIDSTLKEKDYDLLEIKLASLVYITVEESRKDGKIEIFPIFSNLGGTPETQESKK